MSKKVVKLKESDLRKVVNKVIKEMDNDMPTDDMGDISGDESWRTPSTDNLSIGGVYAHIKEFSIDVEGVEDFTVSVYVTVPDDVSPVEDFTFEIGGEGHMMSQDAQQRVIDFVIEALKNDEIDLPSVMTIQ